MQPRSISIATRAGIVFQVMHFARCQRESHLQQKTRGISVACAHTPLIPNLHSSNFMKMKVRIATHEPERPLPRLENAGISRSYTRPRRFASFHSQRTL